MVAPMKADLTEAGFSELITEADVDTALAKEGTTLVVLNSVCGCAAGSMRPGVKLAVKHSKVPTNLTTAFAGADREAVDRARKFMLANAHRCTHTQTYSRARPQVWLIVPPPATLTK